MTIPEASVTETAQRERGAVLLDVREDEEWAAGHVPDAVHVPMSRLTRDDIPDGRPVYVICRSGNRSGRVVEALTAAGIESKNVGGGMLAWAEAGLPVV